MGGCKMSSVMMGVCVYGALVLMMMMAREVAGQAAPAPSVDCPTVVFTLTDCLPFVTGNDKTPPTAACCRELSAVIKNSPQCLCLLFNTTFTQTLNVNVTRAQQLPPACKLQTPPTSLCSLVGVPVPGPMSASSPMLAPSSAKTPVKTPASSMAPTAPASGPAMTNSPTTTPAPSSGPAAAATPKPSPPSPMSVASPMAQLSNTTTASAPSSAPIIMSRGAAISASLLVLASIILS